DAAALSAVLTAREWHDRRLGVNETIAVPNRAIWIATGNNVTTSTEIERRSVHCRLDAHSDRPWERTRFRHRDLRGWARAHRPALVAACLTLVRAWLHAGGPAGPRKLRGLGRRPRRHPLGRRHPRPAREPARVLRARRHAGRGRPSVPRPLVAAVRRRPAARREAPRARDRREQHARPRRED